MVQSRRACFNPRPMITALSMAALLTAMAGLLGGCNTTAGFGEDMQSAGSAVEHSADRNK